MLGEPQDPEQISHGEAIDPETGVISAERRAVLHRRMNQLARRVVGDPETLWSDSISEAGSANADNARIPAGYTYLLQLIGHDMVDSSPAATPGTKAGIVNGRIRPLMLDTVYGLGPDSCPWAYEADFASDAFRNEPGRLPRRYLRTARLDRQKMPAKNWCCPMQDLARTGTPGASGETELTDVLIADPRNDAHALMSQMTVLFHVAHNTIYRIIAEATDNLKRTDTEMAQRIFACARAVLTLIYRRIVRFDVLPLILHPDVMAIYGHATTPLTEFRGVPVEFSCGAFRFGHAMVRRDYIFNSGRQPAGETGFVVMNSRRMPQRMPLDPTWMVDWAFFFDLRGKMPDAPAPNFSRRIGPRYSNVLDVDPVFLRHSENDGAGLSYRDYRSSIYAGQWKVRRLSALLATQLDERQLGGGARLVQDFDSHWKPMIAKWLARDGEPSVSAEVIEKLSTDPPWPFFVLFEAAFRDQDGTVSSATMGHHLGPVGSLVVAETIVGALAATEVVRNEWNSLKGALAAVCKLYLGSETAVPALTGADVSIPEDMAAFLVFLAGFGAFRREP